LARLIRICGWLTVAAHVFLIPISYGIAAVTPFGRTQPEETAFLNAVVGAVKGFSPWALAWIPVPGAADSILGDATWRSLLLAGSLLISTSAFLLVFNRLASNPTDVHESTERALLRWAVFFAAASVFIYPMMTQDFWLSVVWGRMIAAGENPFYEYFSSHALAGTPLFFYPTQMTYGPLWALISGGVSILGRENALLEFLLFKLLLAAGWLLSVLLVRRILTNEPPARRALGICLFAWLPGSLHFSVAEGHNDILLALFVLLWLFYVQRGNHYASPAALAASVLTKYVTAPLLALELAHGLSRKDVLKPRYVLSLGSVAVLAVLVFLPFWRDPGLFSPVLSMQTWEFLTPTQALVVVGQWTHLPLSERKANLIVGALLGVCLVYYAWQYRRRQDFNGLVEMVLTTTLSILFLVVGHVWPWFVLWLLGPAAVAIKSAQLRIVFPILVLSPFVHLYWVMADSWSLLHYASVFFYSAVAVGFLILRPAFLNGSTGTKA